MKHGMQTEFNRQFAKHDSLIWVSISSLQMSTTQFWQNQNMTSQEPEQIEECKLIAANNERSKIRQFVSNMNWPQTRTHQQQTSITSISQGIALNEECKLTSICSR
jgi:hypothetical protein